MCFSHEKVKQTDSMRKKGQSHQTGNEKEQTFGWEEIAWIYCKEIYLVSCCWSHLPHIVPTVNWKAKNERKWSEEKQLITMNHINITWIRHVFCWRTGHLLFAYGCTFAEDSQRVIWLSEIFGKKKMASLAHQSQFSKTHFSPLWIGVNLYRAQNRKM